jgi:hypothetical protein
MDNNKRLLWYVVGAVVILVVLAVVFRGKGGWSGYPMATPTPSASVAPTPSVVSRATPKPIAMPANYTEAIRQYGNRRIQFDMYCQATPVNNTYKSGLGIMLDNRSGDARIIAVGGVQYHLAGYGWTIIIPQPKTLPATLAVDCGAARNVSKILIQQ